MMLHVLPHRFTVCRLASAQRMPLDADFCFLGKTDEELSLVCPTELVPAETLAREDGWRGFRIVGVLDFSLVGILSAITQVLAEAEIGIFAVSTFNTDYVLVKEENLSRALDVLAGAGYDVC